MIASASLMKPVLNGEALRSNRAGTGHLEVKLISGLSTVTSVCARSPLRLLTPRSRGPSIWAYLSSFGGGLVAGDETRLDLHIGKHARCFMTTQASTKVYRNPQGRPCGHVIEATLDAGSTLVLAPDPVQAFAGANYTQAQKFRLEPDSGLVLVDCFCCGRLARGERWAFTRFESRNEVSIGSERLVLDSMLLDPSDGPLDGAHRLGRFNCLALILIIGEPLRHAAARLLEEWKEKPIVPRASLISSASPVRSGALVRLAGEKVEEVAREIRNSLAFVPDLLGDDPWARKW